MKFFKKLNKKEEKAVNNSRNTAKERLHLVLMQDRANVSVDFLELMKQEIIEVIKKYIDIDETSIDVELTNQENEDGTNGAPVLYANIPIINIKSEAKKIEIKEEEKKTENKEDKQEKEEDKTSEDSEIEEKEDKETKKDNKERKKDHKKTEKVEVIIDDGENSQEEQQEKKEDHKSEN